jgi:antibiotic biosynthesis monooxygenase (ABM) superfamily enzyme
MFGTIGHCRLKPGSEAHFQALMDEWKQTIRPRFPGGMIELTGHPAANPDDLVFISLMQHEATFRALADDPAQDTWYQRFAELVEGEVRWEDIEAEITLQD